MQSRVEYFIQASRADGFLIENLIASFYKNQPTPRNLFVDGGVYQGFHSWRAATAFNKVVGVEANPRTYAELLQRLQLQDPEIVARTTVIHAALGCRKEDGILMDFFASETHPGRSTARPYVWGGGHGEVGYQSPTQISCLELDDIRAIHAGNATVDFVKLDLEGHELSALRGADKVLSLDRPNICIEFGIRPHNEKIMGESLHDFRVFLDRYGYRAFTPWAEDVTDLFSTEGAPFWYLFLFPESDKLEYCRQLLLSLFETVELPAVT